jgi:hypothetical protein
MAVGLTLRAVLRRLSRCAILNMANNRRYPHRQVNERLIRLTKRARLFQRYAVNVMLGGLGSSLLITRLSSVYASLCTSQYLVQDSRPSGSLLLSRKALLSSCFMPVYPGAPLSPDFVQVASWDSLL